MIPGFQLPKERPQSAEQAVLITNETLQSAGLENARVILVEPATGPDGFAGALVDAMIPERDLGDLLARVAATKAAEQGAKVVATALQLSSGGPDCVKLSTSLTAKMMMATITLRLEGEIFVANRHSVGVRKLTLDPGTGMFAGMASAFVRPRLLELEGKTIDVAGLAGMPLDIRSLNCEGGSLNIRVSA